MSAQEVHLNPWLVLVAALALWAAYFYTIDRLVMEGQGLPVQTNMMPQ